MASRYRKYGWLGLVVLIASVSVFGMLVLIRSPRAVEAAALSPQAEEIIQSVYTVELRDLRKESRSISSTYVVTNLGSSTATLATEFYDTDGAMVPLPAPLDTLEPRESKLYDLTMMSLLPDGFAGDAIIMSDQPITASIEAALPSVDIPYCLVGTDTHCIQLAGLRKTSGSISSTYRITNLAALTSRIQHRFYDDEGRFVWLFEDPIAGGTHKDYDLTTMDDIPGGFSGSVVVYAWHSLRGSVVDVPASSASVFLPLVVRQQPPPPPVTGVHVLANHSAYVDSINYLHIVGEVQNSTANHLRFVKVAANVFGSSGQLLATDYTYIRLDNLPAGDRTCFEVLMEAPPGWSTYEFETPTYWTDGERLPHLSVFNDSGAYRSTYGWYEIIGQVRNDDSVPVDYVSPVGTIYDASGTIVGCDFTFVNSTHLDPGQTSAFEMTFTGRDYGSVVSYRLQVDGNPQ